MIIALLRFELALHLRQASFRIAAVAFFLIGLLMSFGSFGGSAVFRDAPSSLCVLVGLLSLGAYMAVSLLTGTAILRDYEHRMEGIIHATGLTHAHFLTSRFLGLVCAASLCLSLGVLGLYLGRFLPTQDPSRFSSLSPLPYLNALVLIGLPNLLLGCAGIFAAAALTRNALATYLSGVAFYAFYWVGSMLGNSPLMAQAKPLAKHDAQLAGLIEPIGLVALFEQARYWTVEQRNATLPALSGELLHNRLLWLGVSLSLFALTYRAYGFRANRRTRPPRRQPEAPTPTVLPELLPLAPASAGWQRDLAALRSHAYLAVKSLLRGLPFIGMMVLWVPFTLINLTDNLRSQDYSERYQPWTELLLPTLLEPLMVFGALAVLFFAAELFWRERSNRIDGLVDATPCPPAALQLGRLCALAVLITALVTCSAALGILLQLGRPPGPNWALYLSLYARAGLPLLFLAALALALHTWVANKYIGLAISLLAAICLTGLILPDSLLIKTPMFRFAHVPAFEASPMAGVYGDGALPLFLLLGLALATVLTAASLPLLRRGLTRALAWRGATRAIVVCALVASLALAARVHHLTYNTGRQRDKAERLDQQEAYERQYAALRRQPLPSVRTIRIAGHVLATERRLAYEGTLELENANAEPLTSVNFGLDRRLELGKLTLAGAELEHVDRLLSQYRFRFLKPLAPGARSDLRFSLSIATSPFADLDSEAYITPDATYVELDKLLPRLGFQDRWTISSVGERKKRGLPLELPTDENLAAESWVELDLNFSCPADQTIVTPGHLEEQRLRNDRAYFHYRAKQPLPTAIALAAAPYQTRKLETPQGSVTVFYHAGHEQALPGLLEGARDALAAYSQRFGAYPSDALNIVEISSFSDTFGATSYPGAIYVVENRVFMLDQDPERQVVSYRTMAHEVAHQWWGWQLEPAYAPGARFLTETLAEYCEISLTEQRFGPEATTEYLEWTRDLYFSMRSFASKPEPSLVEVDNQHWSYYFKGAHAVHALTKLLGQEKIDQVLKTFLAEWGYPRLPQATELARRLEEAAAPEHRPLIQEWLRQVAWAELELNTAVELPALNGRRQLQLELTLRRFQGDTKGRAKLQKAGSWLEIGIGSEKGPQAIKRVWVPDHKATITLPTTATGDTVWLDPRGLMLSAPGNGRQATLSQETAPISSP